MGLPSAREIELAGLKAWPGLESEHDGRWIRRAAGGYTKRANSVQSLDPADDRDATARLAAAEAWFRVRRLPPVFRVTPLAGPSTRAALEAAGWAAQDHSRVMGLPLAPAEADRRGEVLPQDGRAWLESQRLLQGYDEARRDRLLAIVGALSIPAAGIVVRGPDGGIVASALFGVADGIACAGNVVTARGERGKGYGKALMRTGLAWASGAGAAYAALNVAANNGAALALYSSLGYAPLYDYHYCMPGSP